MTCGAADYFVKPLDTSDSAIVAMRAVARAFARN